MPQLPQCIQPAGSHGNVSALPKELAHRGKNMTEFGGLVLGFFIGVTVTWLLKTYLDHVINKKEGVGEDG